MSYFYILSLLFVIGIIIYGYHSNKINTDIFINKLTYNKSLKHSLINYGLILLGLYCYQSSLVYKTITVVTIIQLLLLVFIKPLVGVSLIWSSLLGVSLLKCKNNKERAFLIASLLVLIYYSFTYPFSTTVAHISAALVSYFYLRNKI